MSIHITDHAPREFMVEQAAYALLKPNNYASPDERRYTTHAPFLSVALNADDLIAESNYHVGIAAFAELFGPEGAGWFTARETHWAAGPLDVLFVQVKDKDGWRPEWQYAMDLAYKLAGYAVLDEEDYVAREHEQFSAWWDGVVGDLAAEHEDDTSEQVTAIAALVLENMNASHIGTPWSGLIQDWDVCRDLYFERVAHEAFVAQIEGQGALL